jgi:hypothetical protein
MQAGVKIIIDAKDLAKASEFVTRLSDFDENDLVTQVVELGKARRGSVSTRAARRRTARFGPRIRRALRRFFAPATTCAARSPRPLTGHLANGERAFLLRISIRKAR